MCIVCTKFHLCAGTELTCPAGETYTYEGPRCPEACGLETDRCSGDDQEGCICSSGFTREGNSCVDPNTCGCTDPESGVYYAVRLSSTCSHGGKLNSSGHILCTIISARGHLA